MGSKVPSFVRNQWRVHYKTTKEKMTLIVYYFLYLAAPSFKFESRSASPQGRLHCGNKCYYNYHRVFFFSFFPVWPFTRADKFNFAQLFWVHKYNRQKRKEERNSSPALLITETKRPYVNSRGTHEVNEIEFFHLMVALESYVTREIKGSGLLARPRGSL